MINRLTNIVIILWWKMFITFGYKRDSKPIPEGQYCYAPDNEKNKKENSLFNKGKIYYVKSCTYYKKITNSWYGCGYLGIITDDFLFTDQCKIMEK